MLEDIEQELTIKEKYGTKYKTNLLRVSRISGGSNVSFVNHNGKIIELGLIGL